MGGVSPNDKETNLVTNEDSVTAELTFDKLHEMIDVLSQAAQVMNPNAPVLLTVGSAVTLTSWVASQWMVITISLIAIA